MRPSDPVTDETSTHDSALPEDKLSQLLALLRAISDSGGLRGVDGAIVWPTTQPPAPEHRFDERLRRMEQDLQRLISVVCTRPAATAYVGNGLLFVPTSMGFPLMAFADDLQITAALLMKGQWDTPTTHLLERVLKPGDRFLDIGANIGYFTIFASALVGFEGRVHSFEPNPRTYDLLSRNVRLNTVGHVCRLYRTALVDRVGTRTLHTFVRNQGGSTLAALPQRLLDEFLEQPAAVQVPATTLDSAFEAEDIVFSCIKMDAEGSEALIWAGGNTFFERNVGDHTVILVEWNPPALEGAGADPAALFAMFTRHGFKVWRRDDTLKATRVTGVEELDGWCITELILARDAARIAAVCP